MADESLDEISTLDISKLKVPDLKKELKNRGLSSSGNKNDLVERLQAAMKSSDTVTADSIDDIEEDLLNDDDDEHIDERESLINELDNDLDDIPKAQKRKSHVEDKSEVTGGPPKKVILKRNTSETLAAMAKASKVEEKPLEEKKIEENASGSEEKKVIKLSELSAKERLEMRAKKFGVITFSDDAKKVARAERFSITGSSKSNSIKSENNASIDVLKQRAERFGVSVSSVMSDIEKKEKLEKRKERFGGITSTTTSNGKTGTDLEAIKAARLERFKATVK